MTVAAEGLSAVDGVVARVTEMAAPATDAWARLAAAVDDNLQPAALTAGIGSLSDASGVGVGEVKLFLCLLAAYPLALVWRKLPTATAKHVFSVVVGLWMLQFVIGYQWLHIVLSSTIVYGILLVGGPRARVVAATVAMLYLSGGHIYRQYTDFLGWTLDWTMQQMIVTQKLHALAFNYWDGSPGANPSPDQKARSVAALPNPLEFFSFLLFPANVAIGPTFEVSDYLAFANGAVVAPSGVTPALVRLGQGLVLLVTHQVINALYPTFGLLGDKTFRSSYNVFIRYAIIWLSLIGVRCKYYFGWKIAEGAACLAGLGYAGTDKTTGAALWNRLENIDVIAYETSQSLRNASSNWNKTTNLWLRRYVYERVAPPSNLYVSYFVSAFWHGFYPGYYMFFLSVAVATSVHRNVRRCIRPRFLAADGKSDGPGKGAYDVASFVATTLTLNYFIMSFVMLSWELSVATFRSFYFAGHIAVVIALLVFQLGLIRPPPKKLAAKTS